MIAVVAVVVDVFKLTEEILVAVAEIQKSLLVKKYFHARIRSDNAGDIAVVISRADAAAEVGDKDPKRQIEMNEWSRGRSPKISAMVNKGIIKPLPYSQLPTGLKK